MRLLATLCLAAAVLGPRADAQPLYHPRDLQRAYAKGTRAPDGRPGPRYWQNHGRYAITLDVAPATRAVRGSEQIVYVNESPDTLRGLVFKLFVNIHKPGAPRLGGAAADYLTPGVTVDAFAVNGAARPWGSDAGTFTNKRVALPNALAPHDSVRLSVEWHYALSRESGREGMLDSTTAYLAYFYPRVAVYDDVSGWDTMDFTDSQEFYSDFNDYDVTVRAPANYVVWGTGTLTNAADVLQPTAKARLDASMTSDTTIHVASKAEHAAHAVTAQAATNAWHFAARNVPDVAFAVSDHYAWDAASVVVDSAARRRASVQSAYVEGVPDFPHMVQFARRALDWLSVAWPGVPYPFEKTTVVQGFADMEYPMMVNDSSNPDTTFSRFVVEHELAHTWFPFYMGIDETRYGFMDEGWATTFEYLRNVNTMGADRAGTFFKQFRVQGWVRDPSAAQDVPIITPGDAQAGRGLGNNEYGKAALGYLASKDLLGDAAFRTGLHAFMDRWHGKHPIPWDFFASMNDATGKNLDWFWDAWYFQRNYIDLAITGARKAPNGMAVTLRNIGGMPAPVDLVLTFADGTTQRVHETPAIWAANHAQTTVTVPASKAVTAIALDGGIWMDADGSNDTWKAGK